VKDRGLSWVDKLLDYPLNSHLFKASYIIF